jgi:hypothetical protein
MKVDRMVGSMEMKWAVSTGMKREETLDLLMAEKLVMN